MILETKKSISESAKCFSSKILELKHFSGNERKPSEMKQVDQVLFKYIMFFWN